MSLDPRSLLELLIPALWIGWLLYWWIAARGAKAVQRRESALSRTLHTVPLALAAWLLAASRVPIALLNLPVAPRSLALYAAGVIVTAVGLAFSVWARVHIAGNWSATVTIKKDHALVRDGPDRYVRHPIYRSIPESFSLSSARRWRATNGAERLPLRWRSRRCGASSGLKSAG
jgi:protein-S-isoprenylcysteine O-methyltransferase Ste14